MAELAVVGVVHGVLKLGLVQPSADRNVLSGLHIKRDPLDPGEVGPQPRDDPVDRVTFAMGLELNEDAAVIEGVEATAGTDRRSYCGNRRILHYGIEQRLLAFLHGLEGNILRRLGLADDQPGILLGKETL